MSTLTYITIWISCTIFLGNKTGNCNYAGKMFTTETQQYIDTLDWILSQSAIAFETQNIKDANPQTCPDASIMCHPV